MKSHDPLRGGWYFITLVVRGRRRLLGQVQDRRLLLTGAGDAVAREWLRSEELRQEVRLGPWVVMPDHFHALVEVRGTGARPTDRFIGESPCLPPSPRTISTLAGGFKAASTREVNLLLGTPGDRLWQRGFYDRVVRDDGEWDRIARYIRDNPDEWLRRHRQ